MCRKERIHFQENASLEGFGRCSILWEANDPKYLWLKPIEIWSTIKKQDLGYLAWCGLLAISISVTGWREGHEAFWFDDLEPPENQQQDQSTEEHGLTCDALTSTRSIWIVPNLGSRNLNGSRDLRWHINHREPKHVIKSLRQETWQPCCRAGLTCAMTCHGYLAGFKPSPKKMLSWDHPLTFGD